MIQQAFKLVPVITDALLVAFNGFHQLRRGMATLKMIQMRLKSVKNIQKITQSMKMVSAAKYARAERDLKEARPYGEGASQFYEKTEIAGPPEGKELFIAMTSDRGLCGAAHTGVTRLIRDELIARANNNNIKIVCVGDKSRIILQRLFADKFIFVAKEIGREPPTFLDASKIAIEVLTSGYDYTHGKIVYNKFRTVISYSLSELAFYNLNSIETSDKLIRYDSLDSEVIQDYLEFSLVSKLYYAMKEGATSEQSARMSAMDNATRNAGELIQKLSMNFNRTRQGVITNELIEIVAGASAVQ